MQIEVDGQKVPLSDWKLDVDGNVGTLSFNTAGTGVAFSRGSGTVTFNIAPAVAKAFGVTMADLGLPDDDYHFGDILRYRPEDDPDDGYRFVFVARAARDYIEAMVVRVPTEDDVWEIGDVVTAGINELVPA